MFFAIREDLSVPAAGGTPCRRRAVVAAGRVAKAGHAPNQSGKWDDPPSHGGSAIGVARRRPRVVGPVRRGGTGSCGRVVVGSPALSGPATPRAPGVERSAPPAARQRADRAYFLGEAFGVGTR